MNGYDLIIPVYNEKNIINLLKYVLDNSKKILNIYICYDNKKDITIKIINESQYKSNPKIKLLQNPKLGPCEAIKNGFEISQANCLIVYPADDFHNALLLDKMYNLFLRGYDVVCPSRFMKDGVIKNCPLIKYSIVKIVSYILFYFSRLNIKDPTNGFRLFSKNLINKNTVESKLGFAYSIELLVKAKKNNLNIIEIPSVWIERKDRKSNFKIIKWSREYLRWFFLAIF